MPLLALWLALAAPARCQSADFWDKPSETQAAWLQKNRRLPALPAAGAEAQMTGRWAQLRIGETRLHNDAYVDFALKSCVPALAFAAMSGEKVPAEDREALGRLAKYVDGIRQGAVPYVTADQFAKAVGAEDLAESSLDCRRTITDIEASLALDGTTPDRRAEDKRLLALLAHRKERETFPDDDAGERLYELSKYKYLSDRAVFEGRDAERLELRCRLAETLGAQIQPFAQGSCEDLWGD